MMQCYHTWAGESVAEISANTGTGEVSRCVGAVGVWTAASVIHSTFIHICVTTQWVDVDSVSIEHYADHDVSNALRVPVYGKQMCLLCRQRRRDSLERPVWVWGSRITAGGKPVLRGSRRNDFSWCICTSPATSFVRKTLDACLIYTVGQKTAPHYFCNNFVKTFCSETIIGTYIYFNTCAPNLSKLSEVLEK